MSQLPLLLLLLLLLLPCCCPHCCLCCPCPCCCLCPCSLCCCCLCCPCLFVASARRPSSDASQSLLISQGAACSAKMSLPTHISNSPDDAVYDWKINPRLMNKFYWFEMDAHLASDSGLHLLHFGSLHESRASLGTSGGEQISGSIGKYQVSDLRKFCSEHRKQNYRFRDDYLFAGRLYTNHVVCITILLL